MSTFKRTMCMLLSLVMVLGMFPVSAFATVDGLELLPAEPAAMDVLPEIPVVPEIPATPEYIPEPLPELPAVPETPVVPEVPVEPEVLPTEEPVISPEPTVAPTEEPVVTPEPTVAPAPVVVYFNCSPAETTVYVYDAYGVPVAASTADGGWLLMPGDYTYSAYAEGYVGVDAVPFTVLDGSGSLFIDVVLEAAMTEPVVPELPAETPEQSEDTPLPEDGDKAEDSEIIESEDIEADFVDSTVTSGSCGLTVNWELDENGTLTVSGNGAMTDFTSTSSASSAPWSVHRTIIKSVVIESGVTSIGSYAFYDCSSLTSVTIPDSVTSIGSWAFDYCENLTSITIPDSVTSIGSRAFRGCSSLTSVTIGKGVTSIGSYAFSGCSSLTSVTIPDSVTSIGSYAFYSCSSLSDIRIPDSVTIIESYTFSGCSSLANVTIGSSVTIIMKAAFEACNKLSSVRISDISSWCGIGFEYHEEYYSGKWNIIMESNPLHCGADLYLNDELVTNLVIPEGITKINPAAFYNCSSITSVHIPSSITSVGKDAFYGCSTITEVHISNLAAWCNIIFECYEVYAGATYWLRVSNPLHSGADLYLNNELVTNLVIPEGITKINPAAFYNCNSITSIHIPESVTSIGKRAFSDCDGLTNVTIGDAVTSIGESAFSSCESLTSVTIGTGVTSIGDSAFSDCSSLTDIVIPDNVTSIGEKAFCNCDGLISLAIGNGVTSIGDSAFLFCDGLTGVYITDIASWCGIEFESAIDNPLYDGAKLYWNNDLVTDLVIPEGVASISYAAFYGYSYLTSVTIDNSVTSTSIGSYAFSDCYNLTSVTIGKGVTSIGRYAFDDCYDLSSVHITDLASWCGIEFESASDNPLYGGAKLYWNNDLVTDLVIPEGVASISYAAFYGYRYLTSVTIDNSVTSTSIGSYAFSDCYNLTSVTIGKGVTSIGRGAFSGSGLTSVTIPDSVTSIGDSAFDGCSSLSSVTIGTGVTSIGDLAFDDCSSLSSVTIGTGVTSIGSFAFRSCISLTHIVIPDSVTSIGEEAFRACSGLNSIHIGSGVTSIGSFAFRSCISLTHIVIPDSVTSIGEEAFRACSGLNSIHIGSGVTSIGESAFGYCNSLTSVTIGNSVTSIGEYAFYECDSLASVHIPEGVTSIGDRAFDGCDNLISVTIPKSMTKIGYAAFEDNLSLPEGDVYYASSEFEWNELKKNGIGYNNGPLLNAKMHYYSSVGNVEDLDLEELSIICYENENEGHRVEEKFVLSKDVKAEGKTYCASSDEKGQVTIDVPKNAVTFSKSVIIKDEKTERLVKYVPRTIEIEKLLHNNKVYLQKETAYPGINALWLGEIDILHEEIILGVGSEWTVNLVPEIGWGWSSPAQIKLYQEGKSIELSESGTDVQLSKYFDVREPIYLVATNSDGLTSKKELKVKSDFEVKVDGFEFKLGDSLNFKLPGSASFFEGTECKIDLSSLVPFEVAIDGNKFYASIGFRALHAESDYESGAAKEERALKIKKYAEYMKGFKDKWNLLTNDKAKQKALDDVFKKFPDEIAKGKGSVGVECDITLIGFAEGYIDENGDLILADSGAILAAEYKRTFTKQLPPWGPVPLFLEVEFSGDLEAQLNLFIDNKIREFTPRFTLTGILELGGGIGTGSPKVIGASTGLTAKLENLLEVYRKEIVHFKMTASLSWYIKLKFLFSSWKDSYELASDVWYEYPSPASVSAASYYSDGGYIDPSYQMSGPGEGKPNLYDISQYKTDDLSYLKYGSGFVGGSGADREEITINEDGSTTVTITPRFFNSGAAFVSNAYEGADPQTATFSDGTQLAVWIGYNDSYSGPNALNLYYSYYNGTWSAPQVVELDGTTDASPSLKVIDDVAYLAWLDASTGIADTADIASVAPLMDISAAVFDKSTESFTASAVTSGNGVLDMQPDICGSGSTVYVVWQRNSANDWFGQNYANSIHASSYADGAWSAESTLYSGLGSIIDFDAECRRGTVAVAYTMDSDCDLNTQEDMEVYLNGVQQSSNDYLDSGVQLSGSNLFWYSGGQLMVNGVSTLVNGAPISTDRFQILNENGVQAVIYVENDGLYSTLYAAYFGGGGWGAPIALYSGGSNIPYFSASVTKDGKISVLIQSQAVVGDFSSSDPFGVTNLVWFNAPLGCNVKVEDVRYYNENYVAGTVMPVYITVRNTGELAVEKLKIDLIDSDGNTIMTQTVSDPLLSGETREIDIPYNITEAEQGKTVTIKVSPVDMTETDETDNSAQMVLGWNDLGIDNVRWGNSADGETIIHASLKNIGYETQSDIKVELIQDSPDGTVIDSVTVESLEPFSLTNVSFTLSGEPARIYYVKVEHKEADGNYGNDSDFVEIKPGLASGGNCGEAVTWSIDEDTSTLTISGSGAMEDYAAAKDAPWNGRASAVEAIVIEDGVTSIGSNAFARCSWLSSVSIGKDVASIGSGAFANRYALKDITFSGDAPSIAEDAFTNVTATVKYPLLAKGWNAAVESSYGGELTWDGYLRDGETAPYLYIDEDTFPSANFRQYISETFDSEGAGYLTEEQVLAVTVIDCNERAINNLKGIEYFTSLEQLNCSYNQFSSLDLSANTALIALDCNGQSVYSQAYWDGEACLVDLGAIVGTANIGKVVSVSGGSYDSRTGLVTLDASAEGTVEISYIYNTQAVVADNGMSVNVTVTVCKHNIVIDEAVEPDCTNTGLTEGKHCSVCGEVIVRQEDIPAKGHTFGEWEVTTEATITTPGEESRTCRVEGCGFVETRVLPARLYINEETLPDVNFRQYISETFDFEGLGYLTEEQILDVTIIDCNERAINNLKGIEYFTALEQLNCSYNQLSSLDLSANTALIALDCNGQSVYSQAYWDGEAYLVGLGAIVGAANIGKVVSVTGGAYDSNTGLVTLDDPVDGTAETSFSYTYDTRAAVVDSSMTVTVTVTVPEKPSVENPNKCGDNLTWNFDETSGALTISGAGDMYDYTYENPAPWNIYSYAIYSVNIDDGVSYIGNYAFYGCSNVSEVNIPDSVTNIGDYAFTGCICISSITIPGTVTSIGDNAFWGCSNIHELTLCNGGVRIGNEAFGECLSLSTLNIGSDLSVTGEMTDFNSTVFAYNNNLSEIYFGTSISGIGDYVFSECSNISSLTFSDSITSIGSSAFSNCSGISSLTIPESVTTVSDYAFYDCANLSELTIGNGNISIGYNAFGECPILSTLNIGSDLSVAGEMTDFSSTVFSGNSLISEVNFGQNISGIGEGVFASCTGISSLTFSDSITSIGDAAFLYCTGLEKLTFPDSITEIGNSAFSGCDSLTAIGFEHAKISSISIDASAFYSFSPIHTTITVTDNDNINSAISGYDWIASNRTVTYVSTNPDTGTGLYIDEANFPSANFRQYISDSFDIDGLGYLTEEQVLAVTVIDCNERAINNLKGIEYFTALEKLNCSYNQLSSLDLSANTALKVLSCGNNPLTSLNLSANTDLTTLFCEQSALTSLDLSANTALEVLNCSYTGLGSLDLSKNSALSVLICDGNNISAQAYRDGKDCLVDLGAIIGAANISNVVSVTGGTYDSNSGIVTLDAPAEGTAEISYTYNTQAVVDNGEMTVHVTVTVPDKPECQHSAVIDEAVEPTCTETGLTEGSHCEICGEVLVEQEIVPTAAHSLIPQEGHYTECGGGYPYDHYWCEVCYGSFVDAEGTERAEWIEGTGVHNLVFEEANFIPCGGGYKDDHYRCTECYSCFVDAEGSVYAEWSEGDGPHNLVPYPSNFTSCNGGYKGTYYVCENCYSAFADAEGTTPAEWVPGSGKHSLVNKEANYIPCSGGFTEDYYWCEVCNFCFADTTASSSPEWAPGDGSHELEFHEANYTICGGGYAEDFYLCVYCHQAFADENGTEYAEYIEGLGGHKLVKKNVAAVAATDTELGIKAHTFYYCENCEMPLKSNGYEYSSEELDKYLESLIVYAKAKGVTLSNAEGIIDSGSTKVVDITETSQMQLYAEISPVTAKEGVTWKSSSTALATVSTDGLVTFLKPGVVTITATAADGSGKSANVKFDVTYAGYASNVKFTAKIADTSSSFAQPTNIGLQMDDSVQLNLFGLDKTAPIADLSAFEFSVTKGDNIVSIDDYGVITAIGVGSATVKAELAGDPLKRNVTVTVKTIAQQLGTVSVLPYNMTDASFVGVDANGELCSESGLAPTSYALMVDMEPKGGATRTFRIKPAAIGSSGEEQTELVGKFTWASTGSGIATVKEEKDGSVYITVKPGVDGACSITATSKDLNKAVGYMAVYVMDYSPRLEAATAVLDTQLANSTTLRMASSYENQISGAVFYEYDAKSKTYFDSNNIEAVFVPVYEGENVVDEYVVLSANSFLKNQTVKGQLMVSTVNGRTYPLSLSINVKNTAPAVTFKQLTKFNLFYTDSTADVTVTAKNEAVTDVQLVSADFAGFWDGEKLSISFAAPNTKPNTKATLLVYLAGYEYPVEKAITISTETKKPALALDPANATVNLSLGSDRLYIRIKDNTTKTYLDIGDISLSTNPVIASDIIRLDANTFEVISNRSDFYTKGGGKVNVSVQGSNWVDPIVLACTLKVNSTLPVLKPKAATLTINSRYEGMTVSTEAVLTQANVLGVHIEDAELIPAKADAESAKLSVRFENGQFVAELLDTSIKAASYSYSFVPVCNGASLAPVKLTVKVVNIQPTAKLSKSSVTLSNVYTAQTDSVQIIPADASHGVYDFDCVSKATGIAALEAQKIELSEAEGVITARVTDTSIKAGTYSFTVNARLGSESARAEMKPLTLSVKVVNTQPKVTLSATSANLNTVDGVAGAEIAGLSLKLGTVGYTVVDHIVVPMDTKADVLAQAEKIIVYANAGELIQLGLDATDLPKAGTYKFAVTPIVMDDATGETAALKAISFTVKVYANDKYSAAVSASGKLDAILRDSSAITYTLTKLTNVAGNVADVAISGQDAGKFSVSFAGLNAKGQPMAQLMLLPGESYNTTKTYKLQLDFLLDSGIVVSTAVLNVKVGNTALKLNGTPKTVNVFQSQSRARILYYYVDIIAPPGAAVESISFGDVGLLQNSIINEDTNVSYVLSADGRQVTVKVVLKDTSKLGINKTYKLPLLVRAAGQAENVADAKFDMSLKVLK